MDWKACCVQEEDFDEDEGIYDELNLDEEEEKFGIAMDDDESNGSDDGSEGESIICTALVQRGEGRTNYTARVTVTLEDGLTNTFTERGVFQNVAYTRVTVQKEPTLKGRQSQKVVELAPVASPKV